MLNKYSVPLPGILGILEVEEQPRGVSTTPQHVNTPNS